MDITKIVATLLNSYFDKKDDSVEAEKTDPESLGISILKDNSAEIDGENYDKALQEFINKFEESKFTKFAKKQERLDSAYDKLLNLDTNTVDAKTYKAAIEDFVIAIKDENGGLPFNTNNFTKYILKQAQEKLTEIEKSSSEKSGNTQSSSNVSISKANYDKLMTEMENANDSKNKSDGKFTIDDLNKYVGLTGTSQEFKDMFAPLTDIKDDGLKQYVLNSLGGTIDVNEFIEKLDTDGDGIVSKEEMQTYVDFVSGFYAADQTGPSKKGKNRDQLIGYEEAAKVPEVRANLDLWDKCPKTDGKYINLSDLWATIKKENENNETKTKLENTSYANSKEGVKAKYDYIIDNANSLAKTKSGIDVNKAANSNDEYTSEFFSIISNIEDEGFRNYVCEALGGSKGSINPENLASVCDMDGDGAVTKDELQKFVDFAKSFYAADQTGPSKKGKNRDRLVSFEEATKIPEIRKNLDIWDNAPKVNGKNVRLEDLWQFMNKNYPQKS